MKKAAVISLILICLVVLVRFAPLDGLVGLGFTAVDGELEVHFLDVGQADSALVLCGDKALLIDGGNAADSSFIYSYLRDYGITYLDYIIATHPHEDHIGGIQGALAYADAGVCYSPVDEYDSQLFTKLKGRLNDAGAVIKVPKVGESFMLDDAKITFLSPAEPAGDLNEDSLVCRLDYGEISFLFTGDAGEAAEKAMLERGEKLETTVLKVGHHGSSGSTSYRFLREAAPTYAVISTEDNSRYGHPHEATLSRLMDSGAEIYRTDKNGTIVFRTDGTALTVNTEKGGPTAADSKTLTESGEAMFIGNISSQKYHLPSCRSLPNEGNRIYFYTLEEAVKSGFKPCGTCKPAG